MTLELSLRLRAKRARYMAVLWLTLTTCILLGTYVSLPGMAKSTLTIVQTLEAVSPEAKPSAALQHADRDTYPQLYSIGVLALALVAIFFACFLLGRAAFVEIELSARFVGLADALCVAGEKVDQLEKLAIILVPGTKYLSVPDIFSTKDLDSVVDILNKIRPK